jgi:hypothetical protein
MEEQGLEWRFSGTQVSFFCFHYSMIIFIPILLFTAFNKYAVFSALFYGFFSYMMKKKGFTLAQYLTYLKIRYLEHGQWKAF